MVVIAASVCTKGGKCLVSRQFVEIAKAKIEGLLAAFPKLISTDNEHTFVETENVRYVYQPMESLYMVLITNKSSNIMEDLETLHLMAKLVPEYCQMMDENYVTRYAFELVFAMDEVVTSGYREKLTLADVRTLMEMDSHDERIHEIVERNKQREAAEQAKVRQKEIERERKEMGRKPMASMSYSDPYVVSSGGKASSSSSASSSAGKSYGSSKPTSKAPRKGMQLKKKGPSNDVAQQLAAAGIIQEADDVPAASAAASSSGKPAVQKDSVHLDITENINVVQNQDGGLESMDVKGELTLEVDDVSNGRVMIKVAKGDRKLQFRAHPNTNKPRFNKQGVLCLKDASKSFPPQVTLNVLKWGFSSTEESDVPLTVSCWPSPGSGVLTVNMEYELQAEMELTDVVITIPIPGSNTPVVENVEGSYSVNRHGDLEWTIDVIDASNANGSMEFTIPYDGPPSGLFPISTTFSSPTTFTGVQVAAVASVETSQPVQFSKQVSVQAEDDGYRVEYS